MRHRKKVKQLSRPVAHRNALLANLAKSLILHKQITTTVAKAKALRQFIEPILTKAKQDTMHARRTVFAYFQDKAPVKVLFNEIAEKIVNRPGGYTRIIRLGTRLGDNATLCMMELVDYNERLKKEPRTNKKQTRRSKGKVKENAVSQAALGVTKESSEKETPDSVITYNNNIEGTTNATHENNSVAVTENKNPANSKIVQSKSTKRENTPTSSLDVKDA